MKVAGDSQISLGSLPRYDEIYTDKAMYEQWVSSYPFIDSSDACATFAEIITSETTVTIKKIEGEGSDLLNQIMENIWLGSFDARTALEGSE